VTCLRARAALAFLLLPRGGASRRRSGDGPIHAAIANVALTTDPVTAGDADARTAIPPAPRPMAFRMYRDAYKTRGRSQYPRRDAFARRHPESTFAFSILHYPCVQEYKKSAQSCESWSACNRSLRSCKPSPAGANLVSEQAFANVCTSSAAYSRIRSRVGRRLRHPPDGRPATSIAPPSRRHQRRPRNIAPSLHCSRFGWAACRYLYDAYWLARNTCGISVFILVSWSPALLGRRGAAPLVLCSWHVSGLLGGGARRNRRRSRHAQATRRRRAGTRGQIDATQHPPRRYVSSSWAPLCRSARAPIRRRTSLPTRRRSCSGEAQDADVPR